MVYPLATVPLADAITFIRQELLKAMATSDATGLRFPVGQITLSFQVGITRSGNTSAGLQLWVFELGAEGTSAKETIQTVSIVLDPPVAESGERIKVESRRPEIPG